MSTQNIKINSGIMRFNFEDENGEIITSFSINPTDVNLIERAEKAAKDLEEIKKSIQNKEKTIQEKDKEIAMVIDDFILQGRGTVFEGLLTATTVLPDGRLFCEVIMEVVMNALEPEIRKRKQRMRQKINKYTDKYKGKKP